MKRYLMSAVVVLMVLALVWVAFGQEESDRAQRMAQYRQAQMKAIEAIQEQTAKLKAGVEASSFDRSRFQELSEEEKAKLKETFTKVREERQQALAAIEQQIMILKGRRQLDREHEESIAELQEIQALATSEKAEKTAKHLEELIAKHNKEYEDTMQKLGLEQVGRSP